METANFVLPRLDADWQRVLVEPSSRRSLESWKRDHAILRRFGHFDELVSAVSQWPVDESSEVVWALLSMSGSDDLARRTLLQLIVPGLATEAEWLMSWARRVDRRLILHGDVDQMLLDSAMAAIGHAEGQRRRWPIMSILRRVHRLLRRETLRREAECREQPVEIDHTVAARPSTAGASSTLVGVLKQGRDRGVLTDGDIAVLWLIDVEGYTTRELAPELGISPRAVAQRRLRAETRLSAMVAS